MSQILILVLIIALIYQALKDNPGLIIAGLVLFSHLFFYFPLTDLLVTKESKSELLKLFPEREFLPTIQNYPEEKKEKKRVNISPETQQQDTIKPTNGQPIIIINNHIYLKGKRIEGLKNNEASDSGGQNQEKEAKAKFINKRPTLEGYVILDNVYGYKPNVINRLNQLKAKGFNNSFAFFLPNFCEDKRNMFGISIDKIYDTAERAEKAKEKLLHTAKEKSIPIKSGRILKIKEKTNRKNSFIDSR